MPAAGVLYLLAALLLAAPAIAQSPALTLDQQAQAELRARAEAAARSHAAAALALRGTSPLTKADNPCGRPEFARTVIDQINVARHIRRGDARVVDIERVATEYFDPASKDMTCRGRFLTSDSQHLAGVLQLRRNAAGDPVAVWKADR